jgi:predicted ATPase
VIPTIADVFALKESGGTPPAEMLRGSLHDKHLLLVLDNFEQVVAAAPSVAGLLETCPGVKALVTSRVPLHLHGEREYALRPLALPDPQHLPLPEQLSQYAAVALFIERAQAAQADFAVTNATAPAVAEICARLDGLPLTIELAAARVKVLLPRALLKRLERALPEHQQTMRATLAWGYELLSPEEQRLFRRLAVFVGGATLEAIESVCAHPEDMEPLGVDMVEGLTALVDHSLVQQREEGGEARFAMLHVIREYALECLGVSGEEAAARRAHAGYFVLLGEPAESRLAGPEAGAWLARLEREHDNLRAVLAWARACGEVEAGLRLAAGIWRFWWARGHLREGRAWVEELLALESGPVSRDVSGPGGAPGATDAIRARALFAGGRLALWQRDTVAAVLYLEQALALARSARDRWTVAYALNDLGDFALSQGGWALAASHLEESLTLRREAGDIRDTAVALVHLGEVAYFQGDLEQSRASLAESLALFRQVGDPDGIAHCLANLGRLAREHGELARAETLGREALALHREQGYLRRCAEDLEMLATIAGQAGLGTRAARLLGAAAAWREAHGAPPPRHERADVERATAAAHAAVGEEAWTSALAAGRALSLEKAIAEALEETS